MIDQFRGQFAFLSNFYGCSVSHVEMTAPYEKMVFPSSEHYFMAMKNTDIEYRRKVLNASTPGSAKRMGRGVQLRPDWDTIKVEVMRNALWLKFKDPVLKQKLVDTAPHTLIEGNDWGDKYWGVCNGEGLNMLGQLLMELRDDLITRPQANLMVYTAQYRYTGSNRLDITVKGNHPFGRVFAPTKEMVYGFKNGQITRSDYENKYYSMMLESYRLHRYAWNYLLSFRELTFVCFCPANAFCHRVILANYFKQLGADYLGERKL